MYADRAIRRRAGPCTSSTRAGGKHCHLVFSSHRAECAARGTTVASSWVVVLGAGRWAWLTAETPDGGGKAMPKQICSLNGDVDVKNWFASAILPHQAALTRYLRRVCRSPSEVPDLLQETLVRVYESATRSRPSFPKTFLFTTARNLLIDKVRRDRVVSIDYTRTTASLDLPIDELSPERRLAALQDLQQVTRAFEALPEKTKSVIWLRRVAGMSQRETASILRIEEGALEGHMTRGMRSLAKAIIVNGRMKTTTAVAGLPGHRARNTSRSSR